MMEDHVVTRWEDWRDALGPINSRQRNAVIDSLAHRPCLLFWGDSWFSTPLYPNLARQSIRRMDGMCVLVGKPGALASELFTPSTNRNIAQRLKAGPFDQLCLSAGGNDSLSDRLKPVFADWFGSGARPKIDADAAFAILRASPVFGRIKARYEALLAALAPVFKARPSFRVVAHTYAPLRRIGVPGDLTTANIGLIALLKDDVGPWLWGVMQRVLPDKAEGKRFADHLLTDGFRDLVLQPLRDAHGGLFDYADFTGVAAMQDDALWYDEIHPTGEGFALLASHLTARIRANLPEAKRDAVL
jgi:hypothetical protein